MDNDNKYNLKESYQYQRNKDQELCFYAGITCDYGICDECPICDGNLKIDGEVEFDEI